MNEEYNKHVDVIKKISKDIDPENHENLSKNLTDNLIWFSPDRIDITQVMDKYSISSAELFHTMYLAGNCCQMGYFSFDPSTHSSFTVEDAANHLTKMWYHVDWFNGHGIKNSFRKSPSEKQFINVRRFDDRNFQGCFYVSILSLIKIKQDLH